MEALAKVQQAERFEYAEGGTVRVFVPVKPDPDAQPWSLCIQCEAAAAAGSLKQPTQRLTGTLAEFS
ncbi:MAG: hypothetical protein EPO01_07250 [Aquabacterium sp.]|nr:MAG: hypothetical protein EPO01_07250 [Aquabacterium sp.]